MEKKTGIWLDSFNAYIITLTENGEASMEDIQNDLNLYERERGYHSGRPWGQQVVSTEVNEENRRNNQMKRFFRLIFDKIKDSSSIYIFGPSEAKIGLEKEIKDHHNQYMKIIGIGSADVMTKNQMVKRVREVFKKIPERYIVNRPGSMNNPS